MVSLHRIDGPAPLVGEPRSGLPSIDLAAVPWSCRGSFMALTTNVSLRDHPGRDQVVEPGLYLIDVSGSRLWRWNGVFRIQCLDREGRPVAMEVLDAVPGYLTAQAGEGRVDVTWDSADTIRFRGRGVRVQLIQSALDPMDAAMAFATDADHWRVQMGEDAHYLMTRIDGRLGIERSSVGERDVIDARPDADESFEVGEFEFAVSQYESGVIGSRFHDSFDDARGRVTADFVEWSSAFPDVAEPLEPAGALARYVMWSALVAPRGIVSRPAMLMSKNWMNAVWSWDHCFNAMGLATSHPGLAWDQFMLVFDHQNDQGALPDLVHDNGRMWGFVKPPVHGWVLRRLIDAGVPTAEQLIEVYPKLSAWTDWWTTYRDTDRDGLVEYFHGCDSGQDNSAAFDVSGFPAAAPDLAAYLILQMDVLATIADTLGLRDEASVWRRRSDSALAGLVDNLWDGAHFHAIGRNAQPTAGRGSMSQLNFIPLLLGDRLPEHIRGPLLDSFLESGIATPYGIASESPASAYYEPDGYWRGPIWAPTTLIFVLALAETERRDLARDIAERFLRTCAVNGFAENYEATTGRPLRDQAYTWSASVFVTLAESLNSPRPPRINDTEDPFAPPRKETK